MGPLASQCATIMAGVMTVDLPTLIGARLAVGFRGAEATAELIDALRRLRAQSLVVFSRNVASASQFTRLIRQLEEGVGHPLWVMVDHEGGRVIRFADGVTRFPDARSIGRAHDPSQVERQGATEAEELRRLGVRVNLAPCVDVLVPGSDPVIGDRSYGEDPGLVAALGAARIRGLQTHGVAACAKHFPGLGAVPRDPHRLLPTIVLDQAAMDAVHLPPFAAAIQAGVTMVMSSHVCYPNLGEPAGLPATFSRRLIHELLRRRLGFDGLILTDDLEMGALRSFGSIGEAAVRATEAGHDLLLVCSDLQSSQDVVQSLESAYRRGRLSMEELTISAQRIESCRRKFS